MLPEIGLAGQRRLRQATVAIVGCGGLGSVSGQILARAGVGQLRLIDKDSVELGNLQRQLLYTEADVQQQLPKAEAMRQHLQAINSEVSVTAHHVEFNSQNAKDLLLGVDVLVDGSDNYPTRWLQNDIALELQLPWIYGAVRGTLGMVMPIIPGRTPCFRCLAPGLSLSERTEAAPVVGVLGGVTASVAAWQATQVLHLLVDAETVPLSLVEFNLWTAKWRQLSLSIDPDCPACQLGRRDFLGE